MKITVQEMTLGQGHGSDGRWLIGHQYQISLTRMFSHRKKGLYMKLNSTTSSEGNTLQHWSPDNHPNAINKRGRDRYFWAPSMITGR
jgi:hypothetical protein